MKHLTTLAEPSGLGSTDQRRYQQRLLFVIMLSVMAFGSLMTVVTVSLGVIAEDVGSTVPTVTWTITGLMLAVAVTTPIGGKLGDIYGNRRVLLVGLAGGALATVLCALSWNVGSLIFFRVLFGVFGGLVNPNGMSLMIHAYGTERRAAALGWFNFAMTGSPVIGVVVSGPLIESQGWRPVFMGFAAVSALAFVAAWIITRPTPRQVGAPLDIAGALTLALGVLAGLLTVTRLLPVLRDDGFAAATRDTVGLGLIALSIVGIGAFIAVERRVAVPLLKLSYFSRRNFTLPMIAAALTQFAYMGGFVVTPRLLIRGYGWTVGAASLLIVVRPLAFSLASIAGGKMPSVLGLKMPIVIGTLLMVASMASFTGAPFLGSTAGAIFVAGGLILSGLASGVSQPSVAATMVGSVDRTDMGIANGMNQQMTMIGIVGGIQTMSVLLGDSVNATPTDARFAATYALGGVVALLGLVCALLIRSQSLTDQAGEPVAEPKEADSSTELAGAGPGPSARSARVV